MKTYIKMHGLKELEAALLLLKTATAKRIVRRVLLDALIPVRNLAIALAPDDPATTIDDLNDNILVSGKLNKSQRKQVRNSTKSGVEVYVGATSRAPQGIFNEFGTVKMGPQAFMRPAWDAEKYQIMPRVSSALWLEIERIAKRTK